MDVTEALVNCYTEPDMVHKTMEKATEFLIQYCLAYKATGAGGIVMAEPLTGPAFAGYGGGIFRAVCQAHR